MKIELSLADCRKFILWENGLLGQPIKGGGSPSKVVANWVEHLGYVQIDTISVVERAHHHVLWSRAPGFKASALKNAMEMDRSVFEFWSHAASILPMRDFRFSLVLKNRFKTGSRDWFSGHPKIKQQVLKRIKEEGPLKASQFEAPPGAKSTGWWDWKPAKTALEHLFMAGSLMVTRREGFQKVYDLTERVLPGGVATEMPSLEEYADYLIWRGLRAQGILSVKEMAYLAKPIVKKAVAQRVKVLLEEGLLVEVVAKANGAERYFADPRRLEKFNAERGALRGRISILNPFDNLVIQRGRLKHWFGFDYNIECYVPAPKRKFGYYVLPILEDAEFVGRLDAKAERSQGNFKVISLHSEGGPKSALRSLLREPVLDFAQFNGCTQVSWEK